MTKTTAPARPGLSIGQMMKIILLWSGACASMAPFVVLWRAGLAGTGVLIFLAAMVMPAALAVLSIVLVRRSLWKGRIIFIELLISLSTGLCLVSVVFFEHFLAPTSLSREDLRGALSLGAMIAVLAFLILFLAIRLVRSFRTGQTVWR